jgi:site-specific recombinase XerD
MPAVVITQAILRSKKPRATPYEVRGQNGLILRVQPSGVRTWYVTLRRNQRTKLGDVAKMTLARAEFLAREMLNKAADPTNPEWDAPKRRVNLGEFIKDEYTPWLKIHRPRRATKTLSDLKRCFGHLDDRRLADISQADLDKYTHARIAAGSSAATVVRDLNSLRGLLRRAVETKFLINNIFRGWAKPSVGGVEGTRYLTPDEEKRLRKVLRKRDDAARRGRIRGNKHRTARGYELLPELGAYADHLTPMVLLSLNTGLRYGELASLEWKAVDLPARNLTVTGRTSKSTKTRHIPLNDEAMDVLKRWRTATSATGLVFANADGSRIGSVKTAWLAILKEAKIEEFRWHDLRHSFASKLVQRGAALIEVRDLLGHSDFKLTLRYAHLAPKQTASAVQRLMT